MGQAPFHAAEKGCQSLFFARATRRSSSLRDGLRPGKPSHESRLPRRSRRQYSRRRSRESRTKKAACFDEAGGLNAVYYGTYRQSSPPCGRRVCDDEQADVFWLPDVALSRLPRPFGRVASSKSMSGYSGEPATDFHRLPFRPVRAHYYVMSRKQRRATFARHPFGEPNSSLGFGGQAAAACSI